MKKDGVLEGLLLSWVALSAVSAHAQENNETLAKAAQNPLASMISVPFQLNTGFGAGVQEKTQNVMNIQPVVPFSINADWNLITRTIVPLIWQPSSLPNGGASFVVGNIQFNAFFSPKAATSDGWIWGVGAITQLPTGSNGM